MRKHLYILLLLLPVLYTQAQHNPFASINKPGKVVTLSNDKYVETHLNDSLQRIGSVIVNMNTGTIHQLLDLDSIDKTDKIDPTVATRWYAIDPLASKYPGLSPYNFVANNPIIYIDPDGKKVKAINEEAKEIIRLGLSPEEAKYLKFDKQGMVKLEALTKGLKKMGSVGGNYEALLSLTREEDIYEVEVAMSFETHKIKGDQSTYVKHQMSEITYSSELDDNWEYDRPHYESKGKTKEDYIQEHPELSIEQKPEGLRGISLYGDDPGGGHGYSASGNNRVVVNSSLRIEDKVKNVAHELYGHQYFKSIGKNHSHGSFNKNSPDYNSDLEQQIQNREKEAKTNYKKHKK